MGDPAVDPDQWRIKALCRYEGDLDMWFPPGRRITLRRNALPAKLICRRCPVIEECLAEAMSRSEYEDSGVWGGTTLEERNAMRRALGRKKTKRKGRV